MKTVLVTGACGNIGAFLVDLLVERGYRVRALDLGTEKNRAVAARWGGDVELAFGDLCDREFVAAQVRGADAVMHLAAVIPPFTDADQRLSYRVNVYGTRRLFELCEAEERGPRVIYTSTAAVWGENATATAPRRTDEPIFPSDNYARQKAEMESWLRASELDYTIFRLAVTPPVSPGAISPFVFDFHPDTRVEFTHPKDIALGLANSLLREETVRRTFGLGGGAANRYTYHQWMNMALESMGIGALPRSAFGEILWYTDWVDSEESQALLDYQRRHFDEYLEEVAGALGPARTAIRALGPLVRPFVLLNSRHQAKADGKEPTLPNLLRGLGVVRRGLFALEQWL